MKRATGGSTTGFSPATRRGGHGRKWREAPPDALPACVAEMDFPVAEPLAERIGLLAARRDLGYPAASATQAVVAAYVDRAHQRYGLAIEPDRVRLHTSAGQALALAVLAHTRRGDGVLVHAPWYDGLPSLLEDCGRRVVPVPLAASERGYVLGIDASRAALDASARAVVITNPHNPTGRVFDAGELLSLAQLAVERNLVLISDEVHADIVYPGHVHRPVATLDAELISPRARGAIGALSLELARVAWSGACDAWLAAVLDVLGRNRDRVPRFAARVGLPFSPPEGTFLAWLDGRALPCEPGPAEFLRRRARARAGRPRRVHRGEPRKRRRSRWTCGFAAWTAPCLPLSRNAHAGVPSPPAKGRHSARLRSWPSGPADGERARAAPAHRRAARSAGSLTEPDRRAS